MSLAQSLKIFTIGTGLVSSTSVWLFDSKDSAPVALPLTTRSYPSGTINSYEASPRIEGRVGQTIKDGNIVVKRKESYGFHFNLKNNPWDKERYLSNLLTEQTDFTIGYVYTTWEDYLNFNKSDIKINLFTNPAWYSSTNRDEYGKALTEEEVEELFDGVEDEVKVKQLLLGLHKRIEWQQQMDVTAYTSYYSQLTWPSQTDDLKNLKIKHFRDFKSLKDYIKEKVKTCTKERETCIPSLGELDVMETDKKSYFDEIKVDSQ